MCIINLTPRVRPFKVSRHVAYRSALFNATRLVGELLLNGDFCCFSCHFLQHVAVYTCTAVLYLFVIGATM